MGKIERRGRFEVAGCRPRKVCAEFRVGSVILDNYNQFAIIENLLSALLKWVHDHPEKIDPSL